MGYRALRYGLFVIGLLLSAMSLPLFYFPGEGAREEIRRPAVVGVVGGSAVAGVAILTGAVMSRRFVPLAAVIMGGLVGASAGWLLFRLGGAHSVVEWMLALSLAPVGMWLGWLGGGSRNRVVVGTALGGEIGAMIAALGIPMLFNSGGPELENYFEALVGLFIGGLVGSLVGALVGWSHGKTER